MISGLFAWILSEYRRLMNTLIWSLSGLRIALTEEKSMRQWTLANVVSWVLLSFSDFSTLELALILSLGGLVLITELINSAIEAAIDHISTEQHPLAKAAKDMGSASVFVAALMWVGIWAMLGLS